jgi:2'-hydroxyisoflavone reductase
MRLLILGGTVFLGRALTDAALAGGHAVTHLNRGLSGCDGRVETLLFDREVVPFMDGVDGRRTWDAAIDTCGYLPQVVQRSADALRDRVGCYAFVSSISAYRSFEFENFDEESPLQEAPEPLPNEMTPALYGALKAACEAVILKTYGGRAFIVRPGLLVGPHDPTDRFTWWPWRISRGGRFVAPGRADRRVQFVDVRDVAEWMIPALERSASGTFQVTGPANPLTMGELIGASVRVCADSAAGAEWVPDEFLLRHKVRPWVEMPLWLPESDSSHLGFMTASVARAVAQGLSFRALDATLSDTLEWANIRSGRHEWKAGLELDREAALLNAWTNGE